MLVVAGGGLTTIMDNMIAIGPPEVVFPAMKTLAKDVKEACGMKFRPDKSKAYIDKEHKSIKWDYLWGDIDDVFIKDTDGTVHHGLAVCNIFVGHPKFVEIDLRT